MQSKKRSDIRDIRGTRSSAIFGTLIGVLMKTLGSTLRLTLRDDSGIGKTDSPPAPCIYLLWHNRFLVVPYAWQKITQGRRKAVVLTSASKDGDMVARAMAAFGLGAVRGSSSRRGVAALVGLKRALLDGQDICLTPDGPKGPRYQLQPGVLILAQSTSAPVVPVHIRFHSAWRLGTWDRFVIPKPFSRVEVTFAEPIDVATMIAESTSDHVRAHLETLLVQGTDDATI